MTPADWRHKVGSKIEAERTRQRLSIRAAAKRAGFSEGLWRQIESGGRTIAKDHIVTVSPRPATLAAVANALGWTNDSIERLLAGQPPTRLEADVTDDVVLGAIQELGVEIAQLRDELRELRSEVRPPVPASQPPAHTRRRVAK